jgi:hypothetical protein
MKYSKIKSIKKILKQDRYDLTINSTHNFFANGILIHNTSAVFSNILVKRKLNIFEKILKKLGFKIQEKEYDCIYSSRRVIKNKFFPNKNSYYSENIWQLWADKLKNIIPKGFTLYGEIVGYLSNNKFIQKNYHYGCEPGISEFYVYKITFTNEDGLVTELNRPAIENFCNKYGLKYTPLYYYGKIKNLFNLNFNDKNWTLKFIEKLEKNDNFNLNDSKCEMNNFEVPAEGIVLRIENIFNMIPLKLKNWSFMEFESKQIDNNENDIEEEN